MSSAATRSLFLRLLLGFSIVMLAIWLATLAWIVIETRTIASRVESAMVKTVARQILAGVVPVAARPADASAAIARIEGLQNEFFRELGNYGMPPFQVQLWIDHTLAYGSTGLPLAEPVKGDLGRLLRLKTGDSKDGWSSWAESEAGVTVRVVQQRMAGSGFNESNIGFYLLPLIVSLPFLLIPAWFVIRHGLRPLTAIGREIEQRSPADLSPLAASPFRELAPLVASVNRLMERLKGRLEREQEFLLDAAHELKTPLAVIQVNAETLVASEDAQRRQEAGRGLGEGVRRATHNVHQLLAFARSDGEHEQQATAELDLADLLGTRIALAVQLALKRSIELELHSPASCSMPLHRESIIALIDNVLDNAIKYSPDGGRVTVTLSHAAGVVELRVNDEGPGIPAAFRQKVFERFYRIPGMEQAGSGLGLSIVERAASRNRAQVRLEENPAGPGLIVVVGFRAPD